MRGFGSDNHSGVHPEILKSIEEANLGHAPSYGTDNWSERAIASFRKHFGDCDVFFVFNGTAANALALQAACRPYQAVICSSDSHIANNECGAPEFFTGAKLITLPSYQGKLRLEDLKPLLMHGGDQHYSQPAVVSLTQPTEMGTLYTIEEIRQIVQWAHQHHLFVHIDGARIANAVLGLETDFKTLITDSGVDILSFGGTKNGLLFGEAVLIFNEQLKKDFKFIRKQAGQLPSKGRFVACQFENYLDSGLWREIADHSCRMAQQLRSKLSDINSVRITCPTQSNAVFAEIPKTWLSRLRKKYFFYVWDEQTFECRLITSWDTSLEEIDGLVSEMQKLEKEQSQ